MIPRTSMVAGGGPFVLGVALVAVVACSAPPTRISGPGHQEESGAAPTWWRGAWKREWFIKGNLPPTETRIVRDLQTPTIFGSVRINLDRPAFGDASSLQDLDDKQLAMLLVQRGGFAGTFVSFTNDVAVWEHEIDFQPPNKPDTGRLKPKSPTTVLEEGLDGDFSELWWSMSSGDGKYLGIKIRNEKRTHIILTVVGDHFVYARNRARELPRAESLAALADQMKATREQLIELLDCELSYGTIRSGRLPWEIRYSTLPWQEGKPLEFARSIVLDASGSPVPRTPTQGWSVVVNTFDPADLGVLFPR